MDWIVNDATVPEGDTPGQAGATASLRNLTSGRLAWESATLSVEYEPVAGGFFLHLDPWYIAVDEAGARVTLSKYGSSNILKAWDIQPSSLSWWRVEVSATLSSVTITVNGETFRYQSATRTPLTGAEIFFSPGVRFREPKLEKTEIVVEHFEEPAATPKEAMKSLDVTVDFYDDLLLAPFDHDMLDTMFETMADIGTSRVFWIDHGPRGNGFWENGAAPANFEKSFELLGDDHLPAVVDSAHKAGLPLIGIFKPFDTAILHYTDPVAGGTATEVCEGALVLGGRIKQGFSFPIEHPKLCSQRRPFPTGQAAPSSIVVHSRHELSDTDAQDVEIYVSSDNATYQLYDGPISVLAQENSLEIAGLEISDLFIDLSFTPQLAKKVENTLPALVEIRDRDGKVLEFTYGIASRIGRKAEYHLSGSSSILDFRTHGLNFDCAGHGVPSAVFNSRRGSQILYSPTESDNVLGLAMAANTHVPSMLSECEPGAHEWWLDFITRMLEAGVDGVEIRMMNHSNVVDWTVYGFNPPLVEEYRRRYGVDILTEEFSREEYRALRGEFFTDFLRKASSLVRSHGKKFYLHIEDAHQSSPSEPCPMEIAMPWRQWITEGICDGVTLKALWVGTNETAFGREVIALAHAQGIPVTYTPFIHSAFHCGEKEQLLSSYLNGPHDAFNIYEFATLYKFTPNGEVLIADEPMVEWIRSRPWRQQALLPSAT